MNSNQIKDGFAGQRLTYTPGKTKKSIQAESRINDLYITHIGHFPNAKGHYRNRPFGCSQYILIYCRSGEGWIILDDQKYILQQNQYFIIPPKTKCSYGANDSNPWDNYWIHYTGKNAINYSPTCSKPITIPESKYSRLEDRLIVFEEMLQNMEQFSNFESVVFANVSLKYFLTTLKHIDCYRISQEVSIKDHVNTAVTYMKNNLTKRLTLKALSEVCQCSESNLYKVFMKKMRCSPIEYFLQQKMQRACRYLSSTHLKIKDIAYELGYDDPYYFSRLFTKHIGKSPTQYRNDEVGD
ncbi:MULTISPECIES: AraC family transcriptional regulator [unclassified Saccharicrinis]|uniref:AraC family transcriptional regulator n=1 Tax=unclassified Saccharicrinis TaxID=2646859 RepID=UPI003D340DE5